MHLNKTSVSLHSIYVIILTDIPCNFQSVKMSISVFTKAFSQLAFLGAGLYFGCSYLIFILNERVK